MVPSSQASSNASLPDFSWTQQVVCKRGPPALYPTPLMPHRCHLPTLPYPEDRQPTPLLRPLDVPGLKCNDLIPGFDVFGHSRMSRHFITNRQSLRFSFRQGLHFI